MGADTALWLLECAAQELALFAAVGILVAGIDDLAIDLIWVTRGAWRRIAIYTRHARVTAATLAPPRAPGRIAVLVAAWDEAAVIGQMLTAALDRFGESDYRLFVGAYPNDPATIAAVRGVMTAHPLGSRVRLAVGGTPGPTSKADNLNSIWAALIDEEQAAGVRFKAVLIHDAEDVVHPAELRLFDTLIERFDVVQIPVLPLPVPGSRWVSMSYADQFAEAHGKLLVVREAIGAALPLAGTGCAVARDLMARVSDASGGRPFDTESLTEDYEMGLRLAEQGGRAAFVRVPIRRGGPPVAVRAYFPARFTDAVRQQSRWVAGIALGGWERLGWRGGIAEAWMRLRDRRALLAALVICAAYAALILWLAAGATAFATGRFLTPPGPLLTILLTINAAFLLWRMLMRMLLVGRLYGPVQGALSLPRMIVGNMIAVAAAWRAIPRHFRARPGATPAWGKTRHSFPASLPAE